MSDEPLPPRDSCSADVAAYALGALSDAEAEAFRRHLQTCPVCPNELTAFRQVVDDLAESPPRMSAPPDLRRRVMRAVAQEPRAHSAVPARRRPWALSVGAVRRRPRPAFALMGAGAFAAAAAAVLVLVLGSPAGDRTVDAQVTGSGQAELVIHGDEAKLVLHRFAAPPSGKIYEVWLRHGNGAPAPTAALFSVNHQGDAMVDVPGSLHGVTEVMVTPEPAGGSPRPTHAAVIDAHL